LPKKRKAAPVIRWGTTFQPIANHAGH